MKGNALSKKTFRRAERDQLAKLAALPDDLIDTVDITEAVPENWIPAFAGMTGY